MKTTKLNIIFSLFLSLAVIYSAKAQDCGKLICKKENYADYDYRSQSSTAVIANGDSIRSSIVMYSKQDTRIFVCADSKLGPIHYRIFEQQRETTKKSETINKVVETKIYKKDKDGFIQQKNEDGTPKVDEKGNPIYIVERVERKTVQDTVWNYVKTNKELVLFDNLTSPTIPYYEVKNNDKTRRLIIEVKAPRTKKQNKGCVRIEVGHRVIKANQKK